MKVIILAAGKGIRLNLDVPKVLAPLCGMTMIEHVVENVLASGVDPCPIVVIGHESGRVAEVLKDYSVQTVYQAEQLGTGHAVMTCELAVNKDEDVLVIGGDHPLISPEIIKALSDKHQNEKKTMTFVTYEVSDFDVHGGVFNSFGRIVRDSKGNVYKIREVRDANEEELRIKEVNPAYYAFSTNWLFKQLAKLETNNAQEEYYLTDIVKMGMESGLPVSVLRGENLHEAIGINTEEDLVKVESILLNK